MPFCYSPTVQGSLQYFSSPLLTTDNFYWLIFKFADSFLCHLHSVTESIQRGFFSFLVWGVQGREATVFFNSKISIWFTSYFLFLYWLLPILTFISGFKIIHLSTFTIVALKLSFLCHLLSFPTWSEIFVVLHTPIWNMPCLNLWWMLIFFYQALDLVSFWPLIPTHLCGL